jgi:hypothetical protein
MQSFDTYQDDFFALEAILTRREAKKLHKRLRWCVPKSESQIHEAFLFTSPPPNAAQKVCKRAPI